MKSASSQQLCRLLMIALLSAALCPARQQPPASDPSTSNATKMRSVEGVVTDAKGAPVPEAVVLLTDSKTLQVRSFITLKDGSFHFYGLSSDINYDLRAEHDKAYSATKTVSAYNDRKKITINLKLKS